MNLVNVCILVVQLHTHDLAIVSTLNTRSILISKKWNDRYDDYLCAGVGSDKTCRQGRLDGVAETSQHWASEGVPIPCPQILLGAGTVIQPSRKVRSSSIFLYYLYLPVKLLCLNFQARRRCVFVVVVGGGGLLLVELDYRCNGVTIRHENFLRFRGFPLFSDPRIFSAFFKYIFLIKSLP